MVYDNVKRLCEKKNISIWKLERECGIANGTIGKWKNQNVPSVATVKKISDYFKVSIATILKE